MIKKLCLLFVFMIFAIANGVLKRKIARNLSSITIMLLFQGLIQLTIATIFVRKCSFFNRKIFFMVFCSYIPHYILWISNKKLRTVTLTLLEPSKIFFSVFLTIVLLNKRYKSLQLFGILLIIVGICTSMLGKKSDNKGTDKIGFFLLAILGCFLNALSSVYFFIKFPENSIKFWNYIFTFSIYNVLFCIAGHCVQYFSEGRFHFEGLKTHWGSLLMPLTLTIEYLGYRLIGFYTYPVEKNLIIIIIQVSIPIFWNVFFEKEFDKISLISCSVVYLGALIFELKSFFKKENATP